MIGWGANELTDVRKIFQGWLHFKNNNVYNDNGNGKGNGVDDDDIENMSF